MKNKFVKGLKITGGLFILSEFFGAIGEIQALHAMHGIFPDEVDGAIDLLKNPKKYGVTVANKYDYLKTRFIGKMAELLCKK